MQQLLNLANAKIEMGPRPIPSDNVFGIAEALFE